MQMKTPDVAALKSHLITLEADFGHTENSPSRINDHQE